MPKFVPLEARQRDGWVYRMESMVEIRTFLTVSETTRWRFYQYSERLSGNIRAFSGGSEDP